MSKSSLFSLSITLVVIFLASYFYIGGAIGTNARVWSNSVQHTLIAHYQLDQISNSIEDSVLKLFPGFENLWNSSELKYLIEMDFLVGFLELGVTSENWVFFHLPVCEEMGSTFLENGGSGLITVGNGSEVRHYLILSFELETEAGRLIYPEHLYE